MEPDDPEALRPGAYRLALDRSLGRLWADRRWSVPALLLPGVGAVLTWFCPPLVVAAMLRRFAGAGRPTVDQILPYLLAFGAAWYGGELVWRAGVHCLNRAASDGVAALYEQSMEELLGKDLAFFHDSFSGSLTKRLTSVGSSYEMLVDTLAFRVAPSLLPLPFVVVVLWRFSPVLPFALVGSVVGTGFVVAPLILRRQRLVNQRERASTHVAAHVADAITNMDAVRLFGREDAESECTPPTSTDGVGSPGVRGTTRTSASTCSRRSSTSSPTSAAWRWRSGSAATGSTSPRSSSPSPTSSAAPTWCGSSTRSTGRSRPSCSTIAQFTELLLDPPTVVDPPEPDPASFHDASVDLRAVWFRYPNRSEPLFRGVHLHIDHGERVGLVGPSGGGKSTLTRLLLRLADVDAGTISIGGCDIARLRQADVRAQVSYVPQDPMMFHRSLRDNIAVGRPGATDEEVRAAAAAANAAEFIEDLPDGYDTLVGERGIKLSGGQRQRLAIARAVLRAAPILILDEATSRSTRRARPSSSTPCSR